MREDAHTSRKSPSACQGSIPIERDTALEFLGCVEQLGNCLMLSVDAGLRIKDRTSQPLRPFESALSFR